MELDLGLDLSIGALSQMSDEELCDARKAVSKSVRGLDKRRRHYLNGGGAMTRSEDTNPQMKLFGQEEKALKDAMRVVRFEIKKRKNNLPQNTERTDFVASIHHG